MLPRTVKCGAGRGRDVQIAVQDHRRGNRRRALAHAHERRGVAAAVVQSQAVAAGGADCHARIPGTAELQCAHSDGLIENCGHGGAAGGIDYGQRLWLIRHAIGRPEIGTPAAASADRRRPLAWARRTGVDHVELVGKVIQRAVGRKGAQREAANVVGVVDQVEGPAAGHAAVDVERAAQVGRAGAGQGIAYVQIGAALVATLSE